jgi:hypothetical protein
MKPKRLTYVNEKLTFEAINKVLGDITTYHAISSSWYLCFADNPCHVRTLSTVFLSHILFMLGHSYHMVLL